MITPFSVPISPGQRRVSDLILEGLSNRQIADRIFIAEKSVKFHTKLIYQAAGVKTRSEYIVHCYKLMLESLTPRPPVIEVVRVVMQNEPPGLPAGQMNILK